MADLAKKFGVPASLVDYIKKIQTEETEYQAKVKALMAKKGIKSLGDLTPDEKKKFFSQLDAMHQAKNEEVEIKESDLPSSKDKRKTVMVKHKTSGKELKIDASAVAKYKTMGYEVMKEEVEPIQEAPKKPVVNNDDDDDKPDNSIKTFLVKFEKDGNAKVRNYTGRDELEVRSKAKVDAQRMKMSVASIRLREEYEEEILSQEIDESFSDAQIAKLKAEYGKISTIDPSSPNYKKLTAMLDRLGKPELEKLAGAGIKFISGLAKNRVNRMKNEASSPEQQAAIAIAKKKKGEEPKNEEVEIEEGKSGTGYELYHKDFSSAMAHAYEFAKKKYGIEVDPEEIDRNVAMGPKKPSSGKANAYRLLDKTGKKAIQVQVTNLDNKRYELNMYKEEVELEEAEEFKQGGKPLAKKFEKAFAKMGIRAKVKMHTVGNISVNEKKDNDKEDEDDKEENGKKKNVKSGDSLSGKKEPIQVNPEINDK